MSRIDEIKAMEQAATPGPWEWKGNNLCAPKPYYVTLKPFYDDDTGVISTVCFDNDKSFIAHSRENIPYLLSKIDRLTAKLEKEKAEKEAAIADMKTIGYPCELCLHSGQCNENCDNTGSAFKWRGRE